MDTEKHFEFKDEEVATTATSDSQSPSPDENALHLEIQGEIYTPSIHSEAMAVTDQAYMPSS